MTSTITPLKLSSIVVNGHNPRGKIDTSGEAFLELKASIERHGILQPILVGPADDKGKHSLIAGERRFTAAGEIGLKDIPALERDPNGEEALLALVENVQREDLSPVEEARALDRMRSDFGMTQVEAAKALGKSERWARERLRLVDLPEKTQAAFDSGAIPLEAVGDVQKVAEKAPDVLEAIAADASSGEDARGLDLARTEDLITAIDDAIQADAAGCMVKPRRIGISDLVGTGIPDKVVEDFKKRFEKLVKTHPYYHSGTVDLDDKEIDAARAFGCLLELDGKNRWGEKETTRYITDPEWLADRLDEVLAAEIKVAEKERANYKKMTSSSSSTGEKKDSSPEAKEKRRKERQDELRERVVKREVNLELGRRSAEALRAPDLTAEEAELFALLALGDSYAEAAQAGVQYCDPEFQKEEKQKNGAVKVTYGTGKSAGDAVLKAIRAAKKPQEKLGIALRVMLLSKAADKEVEAPSNRIHWRRHPGGAYTYGEPKGIGDLLKRVAAARGLVAEDIRQDIERQGRLQELDVEIAVLEAVAKCRAKLGLQIEGNPILDVGDPMVELDIVSDALSKRRLKEHVGDEATSYTITGAGKKQLEKLKAERKGLQAT